MTKVRLYYKSMFGTEQHIEGILISEDKSSVTIQYEKERYFCTMPKKDIIKREVIK